MAAKVKICGLTRFEDARLAVESGAWAIGMVFHPDSPRHVDVEQAAEIATAFRRRCEVVGVFVNSPLDDVLQTLGSVPLTTLQLHGDEGPSYCAEAGRRTGLKVIKAVRAKDAQAVRALSAFHTDFHMIDAYVPGAYGGTGEGFDWELAAAHTGDVPLVLSGGLTAEKVGEALAVVRPYAVDVASGVEASPGVKDSYRMQAFFEAVRSAATAPQG
ncbi:MAG: phosphoribosylanthranilate isomerase [Solirubrobacterales bacterium]